MLEVRKRFNLKGHKDSIYALAGEESGKYIFTAGNDGMIIKWNTADGDGRVVAKTENSVYTISHLSGDLLAIGENYKGLRILDLSSKEELSYFPIENLQIFGILKFEGGYLVACSEGWIYSFNKSTGSHKKVKFTDKNVRCLHQLSDGRIIAGFSDKKIRILSGSDLKIEREFDAHEKSVFGLAVTSDENYLISVGRDAKINTYNIQKDFAHAGEIAAHHYAINNIDLSPSGKHFVTCSMDRTLKVWNTFEGKLLKVIDSARYEGHINSVNNVLWYGEANIASVGDDNTLMLWELHGLD